MDVFLVDSLRSLCLWRRSFTFSAGVRGTLSFNTLWQHSNNEQIRSLSHFLIISLRFLPTLCFKRLSRGASLANRSLHVWMTVRIRLTHYLLLSKVNVLHISWEDTDSNSKFIVGFLFKIDRKVPVCSTRFIFKRFDHKCTFTGVHLTR